MKLRLINFLCYSDETFIFPQTGFVLIKGSSGAGKSTIFKGINFALFGSSKKLQKYGEKSLSVHLEFEDLKIERSKRPNRLILNDKYFDDVAQGIIDKRFGSSFQISGYIEQNNLNNFILKSPNEKLNILESFICRTVDIKRIKKKLKIETLKYKEDLIRISSKVELTENLLKNREVPVKLKFPIRCKKSQRELAEKNENIRLKNTIIKLKKMNTFKEKLRTELEDLKIYNIQLGHETKLLENNKQEILYNENKIKSFEYIGDIELNKYIDELDYISDIRELTRLEKQYQKDSDSLRLIKTNEDLERKLQIDEITNKLYSEYSKEDIPEIISNLKNCLSDLKKIKSIEQHIDKYEEVTELFIEELKRKLIIYSENLKENEIRYQRMSSQSVIYTCPKCETSVCLKDKKLTEYDSSISFDIEELQKIEDNISELSNKVLKIKNNISKYESIWSQKQEWSRDVKNIISKYEDNITALANLRFSGTEFRASFTRSSSAAIRFEKDLDYIIEYKISQKALYKKLKKIKKANTYSTTCISLETNLSQLKENISNLGHRINSRKSLNLNEDELRCIIEKHKENKKNTQICLLKIEKLKKGIEMSEIRLEKLKNCHIMKYKKIRKLSLVYQTSTNTENKLIDLVNSKSKIEKNIVDIINWKKTNDTFQKIKSLKDSLKDLKKEEIITRKKYKACLELKEKILEAQSKALINIVNSINKHAQIYLDLFFTNDPISVILKTFKYNKKNSSNDRKPSITVDILYKSMKCNLDSLSGGELSRVILAYSFSMSEIFNNPLIMLDESISTLDENLTLEILDAIKENASHRLILIISHQVVSGIFDKIINLER